MAAINHPMGRTGKKGIALGIPSARVSAWLLAAIALAGLSALLPVLQSSSVTSQGFDLRSLEAREARLEGEISLLESEVARLTSLSRIERRANGIGLLPAQDPVYVAVDQAGPAPAQIPAEFLPGPEVQAEGSAPWWRSLLEWFPLLD